MGKLKNLYPSGVLSVEELKGYFIIHVKSYHEKNIWLICSGKDISPYYSFIKSYPVVKYRIIHGIGTSKEFYDKDAYATGKYIFCTSRDVSGNFIGRVTYCIDKAVYDMESLYFPFDSYRMIDESYDILISKGVKNDLIKSDGYF